MTGRIRKICALLPPAPVFADVGCDHGYCTKYMFDRALCTRAYITDISAESLKKAETLLSKEVEAGRCIPVVCNGLAGVKEPCDLVLIAGMGGEEIVSILSALPLPARFVLQPMKNSEKLRRFLVARGAGIEADFTFSDRGKYYDVIRGNNAGNSRYSERELIYGRDNLRGNPVFLEQMEGELEKLKARAARPMREENRRALMLRLAETEEIIHDTQRNPQDRQ